MIARGTRPTHGVVDSTTITIFVQTKCVVSVVEETEMTKGQLLNLHHNLLPLNPPRQLPQEEVNTTATLTNVAAPLSFSLGATPMPTDSPTGALKAKETAKLVTVLGVLLVQTQRHFLPQLQLQQR